MSKQRKPEMQVPSVVLPGRKVHTTRLIQAKTTNQERYIRSIKNNTITLASGSAGVGKSLLALHEACRLINQDYSPITKIYYLRANVGMGQEKEMGFLPGTLLDKIRPLAYPVMDNLIQFMTEAEAKFILEKEIIEVLPVSMVRGRSFSNSFIILDEAGNCTPSTMKTVLSRISDGSKMVCIGDSRQVDICRDKYPVDGLTDAIAKLSGLSDVGIVTFTNSDIIRHPIIQHILDRYETY